MNHDDYWSELRLLLQQKANLDTAAAIARILLGSEEQLPLMIDYVRKHSTPLLRIMLFGVVQMTTNASPLATQQEGATAAAERASTILCLLTQTAA